MNENIEKILIGFFGGLIGFAIPYAAKIWEMLTKSRRIKSAIINEIKFAKKEIDDKIAWMSRDVSHHLKEVDHSRIIEYKGKQLFLGEQESFDVKCKYWEEKYCDITEILSEADFSHFGNLHRLIAKFAEKFKQMKQSFETEIGDPKTMALACYEDLIQINKDIDQQLQG